LVTTPRSRQICPRTKALGSAMGNWLSSGGSGAQPPELLSAAVIGDVDRFTSAWANESGRQVTDSQGNNVLHALFSCQNDHENVRTKVILDLIHNSATFDVESMYSARSSAMGCNPIWIIVAYGNVDLLRHLQTIAPQIKIAELLTVPNLQGDTSILATCSKGNVAMLEYLSSEVVRDATAFSELLRKENSKGTTPLQTAVGNGHLDLVRYLVDRVPPQDLMAKSAGGLSLFHVCCERNFADGLAVLLRKVDDDAAVLALTDRNDANCLHVAAFCRNKEAVEEVVKRCGRVELLDARDGEGRTAYWLAMLKGAADVGEVLARAGVDTGIEGMQAEIEEAARHRADNEARRRANA